MLLNSAATTAGASPAASGATAPTITLTITGLTINQQYQFEWWVNDPRNRAQDTFPRVTTSLAGNSVQLEHNVGNVDGSPGQFAVGTFTADATTQSILFTGSVTSAVTGAPSTQINVFQLRSVPEPASLGLVAVGAVGLLTRRRRTTL